MKSTLKTLIATSACVALLAACDGQQNAYNAQNGGVMNGGGVTKSDAGTLLGGVGGAIAGAQFGKGNGRIATGAIGALLGAGIGHSIGSSLDRADMQYYQSASQRAFENNTAGQPLPWSNPQSGNSGVVIPQAPYKTSSGQYCREFQNKITVGGKTETGYGTACRQPDGSWQIVSQ